MKYTHIIIKSSMKMTFLWKSPETKYFAENWTEMVTYTVHCQSDLTISAGELLPGLHHPCLMPPLCCNCLCTGNKMDKSVLKILLLNIFCLGHSHKKETKVNFSDYEL
jgi:hypothetical protein